VVRAGGLALLCNYDPWRLVTHTSEDYELASEWIEECLRLQGLRDQALVDDLIFRFAEAREQVRGPRGDL